MQFLGKVEIDRVILTSNAELKYIFFQLLLNGKQIHTWGVGRKQDWAGKTMWAQFNASESNEKSGIPQNEEGTGDVEFADAQLDLGNLELRAYRATERQRVQNREELPSKGASRQGLEFVLTYVLR